MMIEGLSTACMHMASGSMPEVLSLDLRILAGQSSVMFVFAVSMACLFVVA